MNVAGNERHAKLSGIPSYISFIVIIGVRREHTVDA
jgi:hypothetical protein